MKDASLQPLHFPASRKTLAALYLFPANEIDVLLADFSHVSALRKEGSPWLPAQALFQYGQGQASGKITCLQQPYGMMYDLELYISKDSHQGLESHLAHQAKLAAIAVTDSGHHFLMGWPHGFVWVKEGHQEDLLKRLVFLKLVTTSPPLLLEDSALTYPPDCFPYRTHSWAAGGLPLAVIRNYPLSQFQAVVL